MLAEGGRQHQAAKAAGVTLRTVQNWCEDSNFSTFVGLIRADSRERRRQKRDKVIALALDIEAEVLSGSRSADDPIAKRAASILQQTEYRVEGLGEREPRLPSNPTQVNVYGPGYLPEAS